MNTAGEINSKCDNLKVQYDILQQTCVFNGGFEDFSLEDPMSNTVNKIDEVGVFRRNESTKSFRNKNNEFKAKNIKLESENTRLKNELENYRTEVNELKCDNVALFIEVHKNKFYANKYHEKIQVLKDEKLKLLEESSKIIKAASFEVEMRENLELILENKLLRVESNRRNDTMNFLNSIINDQKMELEELRKELTSKEIIHKRAIIIEEEFETPCKRIKNS